MDLDKLLETGDRCIHDEPPVCTASCPVHLDVRSFMAEIENGNYKKAYKLMEKRIPFARIIGMICDHPCESVCVRKHIGGAISISELEKAAISYGYKPRKKNLSLPKNKGKVAIIGGGMSGMTAAYDLDKKGYNVTLYEKADRLGGRIWTYAGEGLKKEVIEEEIYGMEKKGIRINLKINIDKKGLEGIIEEYDAVYLGTGQWEEDFKINMDTFQVENSSIFVGGRLLNKDHSVIFSVSSGRRAAISMDRYISKVSITASREREGVFDTPLKYKVDDVQPMKKVEKTLDIYKKEEAIEEAKRCLKCQCMECLKACSHMKKFGISPDAYVRQINHNERIILGTHYANKMINSCTLCGLCKEQCHLDISMKEVIKETRESMVERGKMPLSAHDFALKDMKFSNSNKFSMVRKQPSKEQSKELFYYPLISYSKYVQGLYRGSGKTEYLFYSGCQLPASYPDYIGEIYKYLVANIKEDVGIYLGCCGAPADWSGRADLMEENMEKIRSTWDEMERPTFILACSSCCSVFEKYMPEIKFVSLWEIFQKYGLPTNERISHHHPLNVHDACATRNNKKIHESIRDIANKLGYHIQELKYSKENTKCCGYGGLVYYANKEQAKDFIKDRMNESSDDLLVYCAMCKDLFVSSGKRTYHILDLIYGKDKKNIALRKMPALSERHKNRVYVKDQLLKEIWGETKEVNVASNEELHLIIPEDIMAIMEERYILIEDIKRVIYNAQKNKERFFNPVDSNYLARLRLDHVTYWVKYEEKEDGIMIKSVYSHRMEVVEE